MQQPQPRVKIARLRKNNYFLPDNTGHKNWSTEEQFYTTLRVLSVHNIQISKCHGIKNI